MIWLLNKSRKLSDLFTEFFYCCIFKGWLIFRGATTHVYGAKSNETYDRKSL